MPIKFVNANQVESNRSKIESFKSSVVYVDVYFLTRKFIIRVPMLTELLKLCIADCAVQIG